MGEIVARQATYGINQTSVQRFCSLPTEKAAKRYRIIINKHQIIKIN